MANPSDSGNEQPILRVEGLRTQFGSGAGAVVAADGVSFVVRRGEVLGLVGESGCGKSVTALSVMGLIDPPGSIAAGSVWFNGTDLLALSESEMGRLRGSQISMIFQQPHSYLNPVFKVGAQVAEVLQIHSDLGEEARQDRVIDLLRQVGISDPVRRASAYPHELSGGMAQRVMIAMALACRPKLLIADEPTTALDVTIQAQILDLVRTLRTQTETAVILITHDLGIVAETAHRVAVMYAGRIVEQADATTLFTTPLHPYTKGLLRSLPVLGRVRERLDAIPGVVPELTHLPKGCKFAPRCSACETLGTPVCHESEPALREIEPNHWVRCWLYPKGETGAVPASALGAVGVGGATPPGPCEVSPAAPLSAAGLDRSTAAESGDRPDILRVDHLVKHFAAGTGLLRRRSGWVHAVNDVSFTIHRGETLGLVGESGCGKTTLGRVILRQIPATGGSAWFDGQEIFAAGKRELKSLRRQMQYIFQDPVASLNPRLRVGDSVAEGLVIHGVKDREERRQIVENTLRRVGIESACVNRYPREFSGGQLQRIGIARALALQPKFLVCDEPVSALDVSIRSQVLNLLRDLQGEFGLTYLFIAHDLSVVEHISDRVAVMYLGKMVELADRDELYRRPWHPYTQALMSAISIPDPTLERKHRIILSGDLPSPLHLPSGCGFHGRCPRVMPQCAHEAPAFREASPGHWVACWLRE